MIVAGGEWRRDLLEEHLDELESLLRRRPLLLLSDEQGVNTLLRHDERIAAHLDGLFLAGDNAYATLLDATESEEPTLIQAAVIAILCQGQGPALTALVELFPEAEGPLLEGLAEGLAWAPLKKALTTVLAAQKSSPPLLAAAIELGMLRSGALRTSSLWEPLLHSDASLERAVGLAIVKECLQPVELSHLEAAVSSEDVRERCAALTHAAALKNGSLLPRLRMKVESGEAALELAEALAILGNASDVGRLVSWSANPALPPERFRVLGTLGHPSVVPALLEMMLDGNAAASWEAAKAFRRMTGVDVSTEERVPAPREENPTEEDLEVAEKVPVPDSALARREWQSLEKGTTGATVLRLGQPVDLKRYRPLSGDWDLRSLWELGLKAVSTGEWRGPAQELTGFTAPWPEP